MTYYTLYSFSFNFHLWGGFSFFPLRRIFNFYRSYSTHIPTTPHTHKQTLTNKTTKRPLTPLSKQKYAHFTFTDIKNTNLFHKNKKTHNKRHTYTPQTPLSTIQTQNTAANSFIQIIYTYYFRNISKSSPFHHNSSKRKIPPSHLSQLTI